MPFFNSPSLSPLARLRRNASSPSYGASITAVGKENVIPAIPDLKISSQRSNEEAHGNVIDLEASNRMLEAKVGKLQAQLETAVTSNVTCGPRGPMFGRKTIRGLEMDLVCKRQELTRMEQELQRSETELSNALQDNKKLVKDHDLDKTACEETIACLRDEIAQLKLDHAESDKERAASFKKQIAELQGDHQKEVLALKNALKAKEAELKKVSHSFIGNIRSPFQNLHLHNVKSHQGSDNITPKITNADSKAVRPEFLSRSFDAPHSTGTTDSIAATATGRDSAGNTDIAVTTTDQPPNTPKAMVEFDVDDSTVITKPEDNSTAQAHPTTKHPLTPMPDKKPKKTPVSFLKSAGGSIRRSARKTIKTNRFSPANKKA